MKLKIFVCAVLSVALLAIASCNIDSARMTGAGLDLVTAATISDADLKKAAKQRRTLGDAEANVAPANNNYAKRLAKLTNKLNNEDGLDLNFKVYLTNDVNANATPDGSIRVCSGLMDLMDDDELFFVIGHEIGHVVEGHSLDAMRLAYAASGARQGVAATSDTAAALSDSLAGELLEAVINAQFSQSQESRADAYGYNLMKKYGRNPQAAASALMKLDSLGASGGFLSSHPNSAERARAIEEKIASGK